MHELSHGIVEGRAEPTLVVGRQRHLVRRARDLGAHDERVLRIHDRALGCATGQLGGMRRVPLVELVVARDEYRGGAPPRAAGPARLLPHRRERAREPVEHDRVETTDVDTELERVGRGDAEEAPARQVELERAPFLREVAGAVGRDAVDEVGRDACETPARDTARRPPRRGGCA